MKNKTNINPIADRVLVKLITKNEEIKGGILIPEESQEKPTTAKVVALGNGVKDGKQHWFSVAVGDTVIISKYGGTAVKHEDVEYIILREEDILAIVE
jgi:chaperonin GroES